MEDALEVLLEELDLVDQSEAFLMGLEPRFPNPDPTPPPTPIPTNPHANPYNPNPNPITQPHA